MKIVTRHSSLVTRFLIFLVFLEVFLGTLPLTLDPVLAEIGIKQPAQNSGVQVAGRTGVDLIGTLIKNAIAIIFAIAAIGVLIMLLWGATAWILSGGDKEKLAAARKRITSALIGLVLLALTFVILGVVGQILSINILGDIALPKLGTP